MRKLAAMAACLVMHGASVAHAGSTDDVRPRWRVSIGPIVGVVVLDPSLANYRWDTQPAFQSGAQMVFYRGPLGAGVRLWRTHTTQATGIPGETQVPEVSLTGVEISGQARILRYSGLELWSSAHGGWLLMDYNPDRLTVDTGGSPVTIVYDPVSEMDVGAGLQVRRDLSKDLALAVHGDWSSFALDTAHRVGNQVVYSRERFHTWHVRLEVSWLLGWSGAEHREQKGTHS